MLGNLRGRTAGPKNSSTNWRTVHGSRGGVEDIYQTEPGFYLGGEPIYVEGSVIIQRLNTHENKAEP